MAPDTMTISFRQDRAWETEATTGFAEMTITTDLTGRTHGHVTYSVGPSRRERTYESELRAARAGPSLEKVAKAVATLNLWFAARREEAERAERYREWPRARPAKVRTEWGMVHRERCVHRCGLN